MRTIGARKGPAYNADMAQKKILVVDDNNSFVELCILILETTGFDVKGAFSGPQALAMLREELPDLMLLDLMMPGMSGIEVCQQVRAEHDGAVRIVMYTADGREATHERSLAAGADGVLSKDVPIYDIPSRLAHYLYTTAPLG
ncbi:MAG: response regulator [Anaerolineae bacterium]|nr:response regulator [Anaerolineae bacterium]